jgi:methylated-DNA-protein-cysteine methyltransferase-like protein
MRLRAPGTPSPSYEKIYATVRSIPAGCVATYGEVASESGLPRQARLVGYALHNLPPESDVPWHRVINAHGKISLSDLDGMYEEQMRLLRKEGVVFTKGIVNFGRFGWLRRRGRG